MRSVKPLLCALAVLSALAAAPARAAEPDVLKQVPPEAQFVVVIPNLAGLSDKLTKFAEALNLQQPELQQPLDQIKGMLGIEKGLNESGGVAVIMPSLPVNGQPEAVILIPVTDYGAFVGNFGVANPGEGVSPIEFQGQPAFVKKSGNYAVISPQQHLVEAYQPPAQGGLSARAGALGGKVLGRGDAFLYIDISQIGPMFQPIVQMQMEQAKAGLGQQGVPDAAGAEGIIDITSAMLQALLRDGQSVVIGLDISPQGLGANFSAQFKQGSPLAAMFANAPKTELAFNRLPDKPYFVAASLNTKALPLDQWAKEITAKLPPDFPMAKMVQSSFDLLKLTGEQVQYALYSPNLAAGGGLINSVNVYPTPEPQKFVAENRRIIEQMNNMELAPGMFYRTQYQANALQVDGKPVDTFRLKMDMPPEAVAQLGPLGGFFTQEQSAYVLTTKDAVIVAQGADPASLKQILDAATGGGTLADKGIAAVRPKLLGNRVAENYIGIGAILQFANGFLSLMAPQAVVQVPADLPPVGTSLSVEGGAVGASIYVPMQVIQTGKSIAEKFQGMGNPGSASSGASVGPASDGKSLATFTDGNFEAQVLQAQQPVLVQFSAVWSNQSKAQAAILDELAKQYQGQVKIGQIDGDDQPMTADLYEVEAYPSVLLFKDGVVVEKFVGLTSKDRLHQAVQKALQ